MKSDCGSEWLSVVSLKVFDRGLNSSQEQEVALEYSSRYISQMLCRRWCEMQAATFKDIFIFHVQVSKVCFSALINKKILVLFIQDQ